MKVGMLTGGGDCPGLNAVIRAVVRKGFFHYQDEFVGFLEGWRGVIEDKTMPLDLNTTSGILQRGGTILRSSRTNVKKVEGGFEKCLANIKKHNLDGGPVRTDAAGNQTHVLRWDNSYGAVFHRESAPAHGETDPAVFGAFDFDVVEDRQRAATIDHFGEAGECGFEFRDGQSDWAHGFSFLVLNAKRPGRIDRPGHR